MCECENIPDYWGNDPIDWRAIINNALTFDGHTVYEGYSESFYYCEKCQKPYKLTEDVGYHYPTYSFVKIAKRYEAIPTEKVAKILALLNTGQQYTFEMADYFHPENHYTYLIEAKRDEAKHFMVGRFYSVNDGDSPSIYDRQNINQLIDFLNEMI